MITVGYTQQIKRAYDVEMCAKKLSATLALVTSYEAKVFALDTVARDMGEFILALEKYLNTKEKEQCQQSETTKVE